VADYFSNTMTIYNKPWEVYRVYTGSNQPYTNSLILNNKVFVPIENNSYDDDALAVYAEALPGFEILGFTGSWQSTDALHCRAKGIPDIEMLQIFHNPIDDQDEAQDNYMVDVIIDDLSEAGLIDEELKVFWWTDDMDMNESESITMTVCPQDIPDCYTASIPGQSEDTIIRYYIQALDETGRLETLPMAGYYDFQAIGGTVYDDGDLNMDGTINILDVVSIVNVVLNGEQNDMADLNNDGIINILDIILLVNIILG
jgi:hypothetical protein